MSHEDEQMQAGKDGLDSAREAALDRINPNRKERNFDLQVRYADLMAGHLKGYLQGDTSQLSYLVDMGNTVVGPWHGGFEGLTKMLDVTKTTDVWFGTQKPNVEVNFENPRDSSALDNFQRGLGTFVAVFEAMNARDSAYEVKAFPHANDEILYVMRYKNSPTSVMVTCRPLPVRSGEVPSIRAIKARFEPGNPPVRR